MRGVSLLIAMLQNTAHYLLDILCIGRSPLQHTNLFVYLSGSGQTARAAGVTIPAPAPTALGSQLSRTAARPPKIPNRYTVPPKAFYESSASRLSQPPPSCTGQVTSTMRKATAPKAQAGSHSAIDDSAIDDGAMDDGAIDDSAIDDSAIDDRAIDDSTEHRLSPAGADTPSPAEADLAATPGARAVTPAATLQGAPAAFGSPVRSMWPPRPATDSLVKPAQASQHACCHATQCVCLSCFAQPAK